MKKILLILLVGLTVFSACKKGEEADLNAALTDVSFTVSPFSETVVPLGKSTASISATVDSLRKYTDSIYYYVFNVNNNYALVKTGVQASTHPEYGLIKEKLVPGTYNIQFVATKGGLIFEGSTLSASSIRPRSGSWNDLFWKSANITVASTAIQQTVNLSRETGGIELEVTDAIPAGTAYIKLTTSADATKMYPNLNVHTRGQMSTTFAILPSDIGQAHKKFLMYSFNVGGTLDIKAYDASNNVIASKFIGGQVNTSPNNITQVVGKLFGVGPQEFNITVNPVWNAPKPAITF